jgi:hypothetical protein
MTKYQPNAVLTGRVYLFKLNGAVTPVRVTGHGQGVNLGTGKAVKVTGTPRLKVT